jgi:predicted DNA-binding transcriptional regulator YafY
MALEGEIWIDYTNHAGKRAWRHILPSYVWHGVSKYHEGEQWFLLAMDFERKDTRCFALLSIHSFSKTKPKEAT